jgi:hypothetical protein
MICKAAAKGPAAITSAWRASHEALEKANSVGHYITLSVRSTVARDSFFLRVSIGSGAIPAPLSPARNPTGPPNQTGIPWSASPAG